MTIKDDLRQAIQDEVYGQFSYKADAEREYMARTRGVDAMTDARAYEATLDIRYPSRNHVGITDNDIIAHTPCLREQNAIMRDRTNYIASTQWCIDLVAQRTAALNSQKANTAGFNMLAYVSDVMTGHANANAATSRVISSQDRIASAQ